LSPVTPGAGTLSSRVLLFLSCMLMASGMGAAALAAHAGEGIEIGAAANLLLPNAPMLAAAAIALDLGFLRHDLGIAGAAAALIGTVLFAADMAHRGFGRGPLFTDAAPIGGSMDMFGWAVVAIAAAFRKS
jgi:uncharacterized membrane protein YgdD (TMEM256/DUF423 family)